MKDYKKRERIIELIDRGVGVAAIAREVGFKPKAISHLRQYYLIYGREEMLRDKHYHLVSREIKRKIVEEHLEKGVSLRRLELTYNVSSGGIRRWIKQVKDGGYEALTNSHYGRRPGMSKPRKEQSIPPEVLEENRRLKQELEELRVENALLKKVKALVEARDARLREIGLKPSKN